MSAEEWRPVTCAPRYEVSSLGRVRRDDMVKPPILNKRTNYLQVGLYAGGRSFSKPIHRLVGEAFLGPRPEHLETRHLNGDRFDNRLVNLAYGTHSENMLDQVRHGTHAMASRTTCSQGHAYGTDSSGRTRCLPCNRERVNARNARLRQARIDAGWDPDGYKNRGVGGRLAPLPTECRHGHDLTGANLRMVNGDPKGLWVCRTCEKAAVDRYKARRRGLFEMADVA